MIAWADCDIDRARAALHSLDAGCSRDEWVKAAMAAKAAGLSDNDFVQWSSGADNYGGERECLSVWRSIAPEGCVKAGTLFHMAQEAGWQESQPHHNGAQAARAPSPRSKGQARPQAAQKTSHDLAAVLDNYPPARPNHPYIVAKQGNPSGLHEVPANDPLTIQGQRVAGWLAVPIRSLDGALQTIQYIPAPGGGKKLNAAGASFANGLLVMGNVGSDATVYVCEGIGQAWACAKADYQAAAVVAFGSGRIRTVAKLLRERYPVVRIVIVADKGKEADSETIAREVGGAWVEMPANKPANYDANDYEAEHGADALADLLRALKTPAMRYRLQSGGELLNAPPLRWRVRGLLPADGLAGLYGPSGSGKSFVVLDMCIAVADGSAEWFGHRVTGAPVTYCVLEGEGGIGKRAKAWTVRNRRALPARLRFITQPIDIRSLSDQGDLVEAVLANGGRDGMLVVDTLNRAAPGADENSSVDMGEIIKACKNLQQAVGGVVMLVHHTGKDSTKGLRGHSSLYAALDSAIEVTRVDDRREWSVAKSKDDADGERQPFTLRVVELGEDEDGEQITSCVVEPDGSAQEVRRPRPQGETQNLVYKVLGQLLRESKDFGKEGAPTGRPCIELEPAVVAAGMVLPCESKRRATIARRAITGMVSRGVYGFQGGWLWAA
jgi:putative DNA primase/helicase